MTFVESICEWWSSRCCAAPFWRAANLSRQSPPSPRPGARGCTRHKTGDIAGGRGRRRRPTASSAQRLVRRSGPSARRRGPHGDRHDRVQGRLALRTTSAEAGRDCGGRRAASGSNERRSSRRGSRPDWRREQAERLDLAAGEERTALDFVVAEAQSEGPFTLVQRAVSPLVHPPVAPNRAASKRGLAMGTEASLWYAPLQIRRRRTLGSAAVSGDRVIRRSLEVCDGNVERTGPTGSSWIWTHGAS